MPTPPATKTALLISATARGGGQTKEPPTLTSSVVSKIWFAGLQNQAAGGLSGDLWMASSRCGFVAWLSEEGLDVIVKPPALAIPGT